MIAVRLPVCLLLALTAFSPSWCADAPVPIVMPDRGVCAHRGASATHPENTLAAFREALHLGAQMIEFDVVWTADRQLVLMHDATVDRTTDGSGAISSMSFEAVRRLDAGSWKHARFKGERVPTLHEALQMMPENVWLNVHIKGSPEMAVAAAEQIATMQRAHQCFLACDRAAAKAVKAARPEVKICNMERQQETAQYIQDTISDKADFIQLLGTDPFAPADMDRLKAAGIRINQCCVNDPAKAALLFQAGVQFPLADELSRILIVADEQGIERLTPVYRSHDEPKSAPAAPVFEHGESAVVPAFADGNSWIHHDLWVETEFDSDGDQLPDRMHVSVTRQLQTDTEGLKVPVVYVSSPYFSGTAGGPRDFFWNPAQEPGADPPPHADPPSIKHESRRLILAKSHRETWVPRGYAVVHSASPGTGLSQGCPTIGGDNESLAPKAVIDWLNGRARGFTLPHGGREVSAYWSTGKVGMTGTSYNGTIPLAAATTGVDGLECIIPVAPNTSYYHYYRSHGLVRHPGGYIGEDIDVLYNFVNSGDPERRDFCNCQVRDQEMLKGFDRSKGDLNDFWKSRDYLLDLGPLKAPLLMAHGFNDWNVMPEHSVRIYRAVQAKGVPAQCYFHQAGHGGEPPLKMMNRWFTRYLYGLQNGVENDARAWIVREGDDPQKPTAYEDFPNPAAQPVTLHLSRGGTQKGCLSLKTEEHQGRETVVDNFSFDGNTLAQAEWTQHRLLYVTDLLNAPLHISGTVQFRTRVSSSRPAANLSVWLVSLPWNSNSEAKIYENVITRGWADPQNHSSLDSSEPLKVGEFYDLQFSLQPDDQVIPAGQQIGLMLFSTDREFTLWPSPGTELTFDLDHTTIELPVVGGHDSMVKALSRNDGHAQTEK
ncbi:MAG: Xaa-Pro dipeptidyl-peptidase [Planctomycetaceae bacterium]